MVISVQIRLYLFLFEGKDAPKNQIFAVNCWEISSQEDYSDNDMVPNSCRNSIGYQIRSTKTSKTPSYSCKNIYSSIHMSDSE